MSADILIGDGDGARLVPYPLRAAILGEVHARPFRSLSVPSRVIHFAFDTSGTPAQVDRANLVAFCLSRGLPAPANGRPRSPLPNELQPAAAPFAQIAKLGESSNGQDRFSRNLAG